MLQNSLKTSLLILTVFYQSILAMGQSLVIGIGKENGRWREFPNEQVLVVKGGNSWNHLILSAQYSNSIFDNKKIRIQEMGIGGQWLFWKRETVLNCFLEANYSTQIQANRKHTPEIDSYPTTESNPDWYGYRFYRSQFSQSYMAGVNLFLKYFMFYASAGYGFKTWSYYIDSSPNEIHNKFSYGYKFKFGMNVFIPYQKKKQ